MLPGWSSEFVTDPRIVAAVERHLRELFPAGFPCPRCTSQAWQAFTEVSNAYEIGRTVIGGGAAVPRATLVCSQCFHIEELALLPILTKAGLWPPRGP